MKTESTHLTMKQVRGATKFWALFAKFYDIFLKANDVGELKKLYAKMKTKVNNPKAKEALDFFYRVRRDVILGHIDLNEITQFLEENKMMNEIKHVSIKTKDNRLHHYPNFTDKEVIDFLTKKGMKLKSKEKDLKTNFDFMIVEDLYEFSAKAPEDKILDGLISSIKKLASIKYMYVNDAYEFTRKDIKNIIEFGITLLKSISSLPQDMQNDLKSMSSRVKNFTDAIKRLKQNKKLSASDDDADYIYVIVDFIKRSLENNNLLKEFSAKAHGDKKQTWKFKSGSSSKTYETVKWGDGSYSCNCPGWTRRVDSQKNRICKHVKQVGGKPYKDVPLNESKDLFSKIRSEFGAPPKGADLRGDKGTQVFYHGKNKNAKDWAMKIKKKYSTGVQYIDTDTMNEEKLREVIRGMVKDVLSEGSMDKFYNATVKHKKNKLVGDVVRFDSGKLKISITKGPHKGKYILASPSEVDIIK